MLCPEDKRLSAKQVLEHPFLTSAFKRHASIDSNDNNLSFKLKNMKEYKESSLMQRIIYTALSQRLSYAEIDNLQNIFIEMDKDCDGEISKKEFSEGIQSLKLMDQNSEEIQKLFKIMDTNKNKNINYSEFIAASIDKKFFNNQEKLLEVFESLDTSKDGKISYNEFKTVINSNKNFRDDSFDILKKEFEEIDLNKDGTIDYEEFVNIISKKKDQILPKREDKSRYLLIYLIIFKNFLFNFF